jgi:Cdc6-like AAA superfamily ATPase
MRLTGRGAERGMLDRFVEAIRAGESRTLVVSGGPGVGKTALLEYLTEQAAECRILHATGVQSEMELAFARCIRCARRYSITLTAYLHPSVMPCVLRSDSARVWHRISFWSVSRY